MISIITTLYNYKQYLPELAKSVFDQEYRDWEWIIVDDCSTDDPNEILTKLICKRVHVIRLSENLGYSIAKNVGLKAAQGDYFVMIDADDVLTVNSLEDRINAIGDKLWIHADALNYNIDNVLESVYINWSKTARQRFIDAGNDVTKTYHHRLIHAQTVMVKREFHERLGLYDETLRFSSDNEMWRRAIRFGYIPAYAQTPVAIYRAHLNRMSRSTYKRKRLKATKEYIQQIVEQRYAEGISERNTVML